MMMPAVGSGQAAAASVSAQGPVGCHLDRGSRLGRHDGILGYGGNDYGNAPSFATALSELDIRRIEVASPLGETA